MDRTTPSQVLSYLDYKNKVRAAAWEERLWQQHLKGEPADFRADEDRRRYGELLDRIEQSRQLAVRLHARRTLHAPRFGLLATQGA
ncbi:MAG: hypothetical protein H3C57_02100 [Gammaproteobacteria bacterium]|nr:hypothetical protein [Gammaproteobacteria bacterium]